MPKECSHPDGERAPSGRCMQCAREWRQKYRSTHAEELNRLQREWRQKNTEKANAIQYRHRDKRQALNGIRMPFPDGGICQKCGHTERYASSLTCVRCTNEKGNGYHEIPNDNPQPG